MTPLTDLIARVEAASGPDRALDGRVAWATGWRFNGFSRFTDDRDIEEAIDRADFDDWPMMAGHWRQPGGDFCRGNFDMAKWPDPPRYTASIDAVVALIRREMPGASYGFSTNRNGFLAFVEWSVEPASWLHVWQPTEALALLLAFLRAKAQQDETP